MRLKNYDAEFEYISIRDRADYKALRSEVLAYLEKVKQSRTRGKIYRRMVKLRLVREALLHEYLADILDEAVDDYVLTRVGSEVLPKWRFGAAQIKTVRVLNETNSNNRLFGSGKLAINPYAESVYKI